MAKLINLGPSFDNAQQLHNMKDTQHVFCPWNEISSMCKQVHCYPQAMAVARDQEPKTKKQKHKQKNL